MSSSYMMELNEATNSDLVAFPNLEEMELVFMFGLEEIWRGQFHAKSFFHLRILKVTSCDEILKVFPVSLLRNLQNLEVLSVVSCFSLQEVFELDGLVGEVRHASTLPQLRVLRLIILPNLMHLWKEDSQLSPVFQNLTTLEVRSCGNLTHLLPSTIAESLLQIKSISVVDCKMMKEIIASERGEATDETTFNQLKSVELRCLPNLVSFCLSSNTFSFPSLEEVVVEECPKLKTFSNNNVSAPKLEKVQVNENEWLWDGDLNTTIQHLFIQKNAKSQNAHQEVHKDPIDNKKKRRRGQDSELTKEEESPQKKQKTKLVRIRIADPEMIESSTDREEEKRKADHNR